MKKMIFLFSLIVVLTLSATTAFAIEGNGTEETPFLITNQSELELVTDFPDWHFKLTSDIELEGTWIPLCKQTSSGYFRGVFDGAGYTISNLVTDGSEGGLFKYNSGTIKNLNIIIADDGMTGSGTICDSNSGTISHCAVKGNISDNGSRLGGICGKNSSKIAYCKYEGNIENTSNGYTGGICGYNNATITNCVVLGNVTGKSEIGGICGLNKRGISECYFIGNINSTADSYQGGIAGKCDGDSDLYQATIIDCYAVSTFNNTKGAYGIGYMRSYAGSATSYYDKTVSGLTGTSNGTPKSTAAMKMKQTYINSWDFDTVWGIDKNINDGYPYLLWEYPNAEEESPYTVNSVKLTDLSGNELEEIPAESFYFEINVTKNDNSKNADSLIIAIYDENGAFIDMKYMSGVYYQNQTMTFGAEIEQTDKKIGNIKGFVWDSISGMTPLSNSLGIKD